MTPRLAIQLGSVTLAAIGIALLVLTGPIAIALGARHVDVLAAGTDAALPGFWFQFTFMRLLAAALFGLAAVLWWCQARLERTQIDSLAGMLRLVFGGMALIALSQQIAIWNTTAGWVLAGILVMMTAVLAVATARSPERQAS